MRPDDDRLVPFDGAGTDPTLEAIAGELAEAGRRARAANVGAPRAAFAGELRARLLADLPIAAPVEAARRRAHRGSIARAQPPQPSRPRSARPATGRATHHCSHADVPAEPALERAGGGRGRPGRGRRSRPDAAVQRSGGAACRGRGGRDAVARRRHERVDRGGDPPSGRRRRDRAGRLRHTRARSEPGSPRRGVDRPSDRGDRDEGGPGAIGRPDLAPRGGAGRGICGPHRGRDLDRTRHRVRPASRDGTRRRRCVGPRGRHRARRRDQRAEPDGHARARVPSARIRLGATGQRRRRRPRSRHGNRSTRPLADRQRAT